MEGVENSIARLMQEHEVRTFSQHFRKTNIAFVVDETSECLDQSESTEEYSLSRDYFNMNKFGKREEEDDMRGN